MLPGLMLGMSVLRSMLAMLSKPSFLLSPPGLFFRRANNVC